MDFSSTDNKPAPITCYSAVADDIMFDWVQLLDNRAAVKTYSPDFFHFSIIGLEQLVDVYGSASPQFTDALALLNTVTQHVRKCASYFVYESCE